MLGFLTVKLSYLELKYLIFDDFPLIWFSLFLRHIGLLLD